MKTTTAIPIHAPRRYRWLPYLLIGVTLLAIPAGIVLIRVIETHFVEAAGGELKLAAAEVAEKLDRILFERKGDVLMMARVASLRTLRSEISLRVSEMDEDNLYPGLPIISGHGHSGYGHGGDGVLADRARL